MHQARLEMPSTRRHLPGRFALHLCAGLLALVLWLCTMPGALAARADPGAHEQQAILLDCTPGTPQPGDGGKRQEPACNTTMPEADNAGFANTAGATDFCTQARVAPCARLATLFQSWATPLALLVAVIGTLSALAGLFHGSGLGLGREHGPEAGWVSFLQRLKTSLLISFLAWRVGGLLGIVESLWLQHTREGVTNAEGLPLPPTSFVRDAYVVLFIDLVQLLFALVVLRMLMTSLVGVAAFSGLSKHTFGEVLRAQVKWLVLLLITLLLPPVLSNLYTITFG